MVEMSRELPWVVVLLGALALVHCECDNQGLVRCPDSDKDGVCKGRGQISMVEEREEGPPRSASYERSATTRRIGRLTQAG